MNLSILPKDTLLRHWCRTLSCTEVPISYQIASGLTLIGALLRRQVFFDQQNWRVYPNQSVLFVGPSGIGKDTIINSAKAEVERVGTIPVLGGRTIETVYERLKGMGNLAAAYIPASELTVFFGQKDYQSGMIQEMTDLLSTGEKVDISTKGQMAYNDGKPVYIYRPTLTLHGGSTEEWLHKAMPDGTMEGGFLGRFLIVGEEFGAKHIPLVKGSMDREEREEVAEARKKWEEGLARILALYPSPTEILMLEEAEHFYTNWYHNRFKFFSKTVMPYANRSRDMVLRLAMLMAISREHKNWIDEDDVKFGVEVLLEIGKYIDKIVLPPTSEAQAARAILAMLPATTAELYKALGTKYFTSVLKNGMMLLEASGEVWKDKAVWRRKLEDGH